VGDGPYFYSHQAYIRRMVSRTYGRGRPLNAPAAFIHPCQPIVVAQPPSGPGWAHELKHDGYRLQIHVRDGRVRLYTINGGQRDFPSWNLLAAPSLALPFRDRSAAPHNLVRHRL
jgi:hypothetical protein